MSDSNKRITLVCPTCAGTEFEFDENLLSEQRVYLCIGCDGSFNHNEILEGNSELISANLEALGKKIVEDFAASLQKSFNRK